MALLNIVLPVFILLALGYGTSRWLKLEPRPFGRLGLYLLSPVMVLNSVLNAQIRAEEVRLILLFGLFWTVVMIVLTLALGRVVRWSPYHRTAMLLSTAFTNAANYGLPVCLYAFGQDGFDRAAVYVIFNTMSMSSLAVYLAARAQAMAGAGDGPVPRVWKGALAKMLEMPMLQAAALGGLLRWLDLPLPEPLARTVQSLGAAAVPFLLVVLGMQLTSIQLRGAALRITVGTVMKLAVGPLVAWGITSVMPVEALTAKVLIVESAMPAAINTTLIAMEFQSDHDVVASTTLVTTVLSVGSLAVVLAWLT